MRKVCLMCMAITAAFLLTACAKEPSAQHERVKPVKVLAVKEENYDISLDYTGFVSPGRLKQYSFKTSGKVQRVLVEKGQEIRKGDRLVILEHDSVRPALDLAQELFRSVAQPNYVYTKEQFEKIKALYESGAVSNRELEAAQLKLQMSQAELERARIGYEQGLKALEDLAIISDVDGYVADVFYKEGELAAAGYPAVAVYDGSRIIKVGVPGQDIEKVAVGAAVIVKDGDIEDRGKISNISGLPDEKTLMYTVEIALPDEGVAIGAVAAVSIVTGRGKGVFVPVESIQRDTQDYVYVVVDGRVSKKIVNVGPVRGKMVMVEGLSHGEKLIIEGMKSVNMGDRVAMVEE